MRKALLVIAVLFTTAQVFAATVTLEVNDIGDGWASIRYSADANVSGFGLKVTADSGAIFTDINDYNVGECTASVQGYGIFPGTIDINESTGVVDDNGTPVAPSSDPGASGTGIDTNTLILEMGALYVEGNQPDLSGTLIVVEVDTDCNVCVEGEPIRGNIVMTDGSTLDPDPCCAYISVLEEDPNIGTCWDLVNECAGQYAKDGPSAQATGLGGDSSCDGNVNFDDLGALMRSWGRTKGVDPEGCLVTDAGKYCCCTDFTHDGVVNFDDLGVLMATWGNTGYSPATTEQSCPP